MKWPLLLSFVLFQLIVNRLVAQDISINIHGESLTSVFETIKKDFNYQFIYVEGTLENTHPVKVHVKDAKNIEELMDVVLAGQPLTYSIQGKVIIITKKDSNGIHARSIRHIKGIVRDSETGEGIAHASVSFVGYYGGAVADTSGKFEITIPDDIDSIKWSAVGYLGYEEVFGEKENYDVLLTRMDIQVDDIVITGIVERRKEMYTSSTSTFTGNQLLQIGNTNVINSLGTLNPSFIIIPNNLQGSNPNALASIELRGKTSLTGIALQDQFSIDPNLPLFILDGFESSLSQISNLDMHRIASVTLLKDAASSALYGARSANGVVVVETKKPELGKMNVFYNGDFNIEVADLRGYNMMNAAEKLEFERLSGRYEPSKPENDYLRVDDPIALSRAYNNKLRDVLKGVDKYWLDVPLQTGFMQNHSLYIQSGNNVWQYGIGANHKDQAGVMKGTGRKVWGGWADFAFRKKKWNVQGKTFISGNSSFDSPSADFSFYVKQNPYYTDLDTSRYLAETPLPNSNLYYKEPNHIYNALLNSYDQGQFSNFQQNIAIIWQPSLQWQFSGRLQLTSSRDKNNTFISPKDTRYDALNVAERGSYNYLQKNGFSYQGNLMAVWNREIADKHLLTANFRTELLENDINHMGYVLEGFPEDALGKPKESYKYIDGRLNDLVSPPMIRRVNGLVSANYSYDYRYFVDATIRVDGSTQFGSANKYAVFWSVGLGWNMNKESFLKDWEALESLRLRFNTGLTGNQNFGSFASTVVYSPIVGGADQGIIHHSLGNPNLEWQNTMQTNIGLDLALWKGRFSLTADIFEKYTSPLIATINLPPSTGVEDYSMNVGDLSMKGWEGVLRFSPIFNPTGWVWTLGATSWMYKSQYKNLNQSLNGANEDMKTIGSLLRYYNGYGPDELWAVRSLGIDPSSGREMFLTKEGNPTFEYDKDHTVPVGNGRPWAEGMLNSFISYKAFSLGVYFHYSVGGYRFNEALYNKVENIDFDDLSSNQDRRALYDRWKKVGDNARFRGISVLDETPISSRFIQRESLFEGKSLSLSYVIESQRHHWLKQIGVNSIRCTTYANDFLYLSNLVAERGIAYPFSRTFSFNMSIMF